MVTNTPTKEGRAPNFQIRLSTSTVNRIEEYRTYIKNKTGFYPNFAETVRGLLNQALELHGLKEENYESQSDEESSK